MACLSRPTTRGVVLMRIVIDLQAAQGPSRHRGIGRYSLALTQGVLRNRREHEIFIVLNGMMPHAIDEVRAALSEQVPKENFLVWDAPQPVDAGNPNNASRREAAELIREGVLASLRPDFVIETSLFEGFSDNIVTSIGRFTSKIPTAAILYDLIPFIHRGVYLPNRRVENWYENKIGHLRNADLLLAISESSRQEALDWLGVDDDQVVNISTAADDHFKPSQVGAAGLASLSRKYGLDRSFVMYTGGIDHRKNIERLIAAFARMPMELRKKHQLAIVCAIGDADRTRLLKLASDEGLAAGDVVLTGFIPENDLLLCYQACKLFVFPSWHEGFGLPALEAMKCGRAVIVADRSGLPEVVGSEKALFDPFDVDAMSAKIVEVLVDDQLRAALEHHGLERAREFDWDKTARRTWSALEAGHAIRRKAETKPDLLQVSTRRPRLAFVSPLAPDASGISDYSAELLPELARHYRIDVITASGAASDPWIQGNCPVRDPAWFRHHASEFDRVLYHFGNSQFHNYMFDLLHDIPGVVVLHDFFLSGAISYREGSGERPGAWMQALAYSHGWQAVIHRYGTEDSEHALWAYPCNLAVLQDALGIIVHADYSRQLARKWYGEDAADDWKLIPHLRRLPNLRDREGCRAELGIPSGDFIVCAFGLLGPTKMSDRLLRAWLDSPLGQDPQSHLVFVGQNDAGEYGARLERAIRSGKAGGRIEITGWTDQNVFRRWLMATDLAVQLRKFSRGETSGTVLDCMSNGVPTIVNAHGAMADLPRDAVYMLEDDFSEADLASALTALWRDKEQRLALGSKAKAHVKQHHQPRRCAAAYAEAIEGYYAKAEYGELGLLRALLEGGNTPPSDADWTEISKSVARNMRVSPRPKRLLVDISVLVQVDARSGIQRVVRSILAQWLKAPPPGLLVEPVYADLEGQCYRYARRFTSRFLDVSDYWCDDEIVEAAAGDIFAGLDYHPEITLHQQPILQEWRRRGVGVKFIVYDLLPVLLPKHFPLGSKERHERWLEAISHFDGVICISRAVAEEFSDWLERHRSKHEQAFSVEWFHLGADTQNSNPTRGRPNNADQTLALLRKDQSFLMVGTLEPRKGYRQVLAAFEVLWAQSIPVNLVIVGKPGWMMEDFVEKLQAHPKLGERLIWMEAVSDEYLDEIYAASSILIAASEGEGFGLPLIEAMRHGLPVLARDIPVFREVAGEGTIYFANRSDPKVISDVIRDIIEQQDKWAIRDASYLTWEESAEALMRCFLSER